MKRLIRRGGLTLAGLGAALAARADIIYVQGDVSGTWAADTVMVMGEVRLPPREELIILAGTQVFFQGYYKFIINGRIEAIGTVSDSITFMPLDSVTGWHGLRFWDAAAGSRMEYCGLRFGHAWGSETDLYGGAIYCFNSAPEFRHLRISACSAGHSGGAIWCAGNAQVLISESELSGNTSVVFGGGLGCWEADAQVENCLISGNSAGDDGGGIFFYQSNSVVSNCVIRDNSAVEWGGGICVGWNSNAQIANCLILNNSGGDGGGIYGYDSELTVSGSLICSNRAFGGSGIYTHRDGGGIFLGYGGTSHLVLQECLLAANQAWRHGGGLYCGPYCSVEARDCEFCQNSCRNNGGGIVFYYAAVSTLNGCAVAENSASRTGGGIFSQNNGTIYLRKSTIANNVATIQGGGLFAAAPGMNLANGIMWGNFPQQISHIDAPVIVYSDIQGGWPGLGNINLNPAFAHTVHSDLRLSWGSPCIDSGNPNSIYNDPDGTRADMGAFYYDQSVMVRILLSPHEIPYLIPEAGGSMDYTIRAFNRDSLLHATTIWCDLTLPDSSVSDPVLGPVTINMAAEALLERVRTQNIPAETPMGVYHYNAYAIVDQDTSKDSFIWGKLGASGAWSLDAGGWENTGEPIKDVGAQRAAPQEGKGEACLALTKYALHPCSPNPFNATTTIRFDLPVAGIVKLEIFDITGRNVGARHASPLPSGSGTTPTTELVNGWREAGRHEVTFEGSGLTAGIYLARIKAGEFQAVEKMVLLK